MKSAAPRVALFLVLLTGWFATPVVAQDAIEDLVTGYMATHHIPGLSLAVVKEGEVMLARGFGHADLDSGDLTDERTVFPLASLTKQFTATATLLLVKDGRLSLDEPLRRLPGMPAHWQDISIRQLLNHTSGIPDYAGAPDFARWSRQPHAPREVLDLVRDRPLEFPPARGWKYSNTNYFVLGLLIEQAAGMRYGDFLAQRILRPLGMNATGMEHARALENRAKGYAWTGSAHVPADPPSASVSYAAGGLTGTVLDLATWHRALERAQLLPAQDWRRMWSATRLESGELHPYGFGWRIHAARNCVSHSGHVQGAAAFMASCPAARFAIILLANLEGADLEPLSGQIARHLSP
jgi:D-alanyl-D-alanine carboxypeptidase